MAGTSGLAGGADALLFALEDKGILTNLFLS